MLIQISNETVKRVQSFVKKYRGQDLKTLKQYSGAVEQCVVDFLLEASGITLDRESELNETVSDEEYADVYNDETRSM